MNLLKRLLDGEEGKEASACRQFASKVVNFSSQYGTNGTDAYVARNLAGMPRIDSYGDFTEAFVLVSNSKLPMELDMIMCMLQLYKLIDRPSVQCCSEGSATPNKPIEPGNGCGL